MNKITEETIDKISKRKQCYIEGLYVPSHFEQLWDDSNQY